MALSAAIGLRNRLRALTKSGGYARDTLVNTLGLLAAAVLPILALPLLSRIYGPEHFGIFGVFAALVGLGTIAATGRYEAAIILPSDNQEAVEIAAAGAAFSAFWIALLAISVAIANNAGVQLVRDHTVLAYLAVATVLLSALVQILLNLAIRTKLFLLSSIARTTGAVSNVSVSVGCGLAGQLELGLLLGMAAGYVASTATLTVALPRHYRGATSLNVRSIRQQAWRYRNFPIFSLPSDFANTLAANLPVLFFSAFFGTTATGYLTMFQRIWAGSAILVQGLGETFRQRAAQEMNETQAFRRTMRVTLVPLCAIAGLLFIALTLFAPLLFELVVGEEWKEAGIYAQILAPLVCLQFIASPISWAFYIRQRLQLLMVWQWSLLLAFATVGTFGTTYLDERGTLMLLSGTGAALYLVYSVMSVRLSRYQAG